MFQCCIPTSFIASSQHCQNSSLTSQLARNTLTVFLPLFVYVCSKVKVSQAHKASDESWPAPALAKKQLVPLVFPLQSCCPGERAGEDSDALTAHVYPKTALSSDPWPNLHCSWVEFAPPTTPTQKIKPAIS